MTLDRPGHALIPALCVAIALTGCRSTRAIPLEEIFSLHDFRSGDEVTLVDAKGREFTFTDRTPLTLHLKGGEEITARYEAIAIGPETFRGTVKDGSIVEEALADVEGLEVSAFSLWKTAGLIGGGVLLVVATAFGVVLIILIRNPPVSKMAVTG